MTLTTDMNQRERRRFAEQLEALANHAWECARALRDEDDHEALRDFAMVSLIGTGFAKELADIFKAAAADAKTTADLDVEHA